MRLVVEGAGDEHIEVSVACLTRSRDQVGSGDRAELGADEDGRPALGSGFGVALAILAHGRDVGAGPRHDGGEGDLVGLVRLLHAGCAQVLEDHRYECSGVVIEVLAGAARERVDQLVVVIDREHAMR